MKKIFEKILAAVVLCLAFAIVSDAQTDAETNKKQSVDKPVKIKKKPVAQIATCGQSEGIVRLKATFDKTAKVTEIVIVKSSGCDAFDKNAIRAAQGIKFEPAVKNGEAVTVSKPMEYQFRIN